MQKLGFRPLGHASRRYYCTVEEHGRVVSILISILVILHNHWGPHSYFPFRGVRAII